MSSPLTSQISESEPHLLYFSTSLLRPEGAVAATDVIVAANVSNRRYSLPWEVLTE